MQTQSHRADICTPAVPAGGRQEGAGLRLVNDWQAHLKFNGREPRTLEELARAKADYEHRRRLAEIKAMRTKLSQLDQFLPALAAAGIRLAQRDFCAYDHGKTLRIPSELLSSKDDKLYAALVDLGFREIERKNWGAADQVKLKHGRSLVLAIDVSKANPAPAAIAEATGSAA